MTRNAETRRYQLGLKLIQLAEGALREIGYRRITEPPPRQLVAVTGLTANICVLRRKQCGVGGSGGEPAFIRPEVFQGCAINDEEIADGLRSGRK